MNPLQEAQAEPRRFALAVRAKCWDCEGRGADPGWQDRVRTCQITDCGLYHLRPYRPEKRPMTKRQADHLKKMGQVRNAPRRGALSATKSNSGEGK
jgi:hypothetical protein